MRTKILALLLLGTIIASANTDLFETPTLFKKKILSSSDDAEENVATGKVNLYSSDLELPTDHNQKQLVGLRFKNIRIPQGVHITKAYIQFISDEVSTTDNYVNIKIYGEASDNVKKFKSSKYNISSRNKTQASVIWKLEPWRRVREKKQTPNLKKIIQETIDTESWESGKSMGFIITYLNGNGKSTAKSFNGNKTLAPKLYIWYVPSDINRFVRDDEKDIVIDNFQGVMWQDNEDVSTIKKHWINNKNYTICENNTSSPACYDTSGDTATTYCSNLNLGGYTDWKLPTKEELLSLPESDPYANNNYSFIYGDRGIFWPKDDLGGYFINVITAFTLDSNLESKGSMNHIRCIKELY